MLDYITDTTSTNNRLRTLQPKNMGVKKTDGLWVAKCVWKEVETDEIRAENRSYGSPDHIG